MKLLITHPGQPHIDDIFAYAVLSKIFPEHELIRTRNELIIHETEDSIVFDVGMKFDGQKYFDHHQSNKYLRVDGVPYSSFGLIWERWGIGFVEELLQEKLGNQLTFSLCRAVWEEFDQAFVYYVDAGDNGILNKDTEVLSHEFSFGSVFRHMTKDGSDESFVKTSEVALSIIEGYLSSILLIEQDKLKLEAGVVDNGILILQETLSDFRSARFHPKVEEIYFLIMPGENSKDWKVYVIEETLFVPKLPLLPSLGGLSEEDLEKESGITGIKFVHTGLFIGVCKTYEVAKALADISLKQLPE
jgi:uncharacterized UPF0160 family protein